MVREDHAIDLDEQHLARMRERLHALYHRELRPIDGIADVLGHLQERRCVASSSQLERIRLSLSVTGLLDWFDPHIFSAAMVAEGKPAPDLFLHAAAQMGVPSPSCVVVEDSPTGVEAAKRAGMRVLAFAGGSHARSEVHRASLRQVMPDYIFDDMRLLPQILGNI